MFDVFKGFAFWEDLAKFSMCTIFENDYFIIVPTKGYFILIKYHTRTIEDEVIVFFSHVHCYVNVSCIIFN